MKLKRKSIVMGSILLLDCIFAGVVVSSKVMGETTNTIVAKKSYLEGTSLISKLEVMSEDANLTMEYNTLSQEDILIAQDIILNEQNTSVKIDNVTTPLTSASLNADKVTSNVIVKDKKDKKKQKEDEAALAASIANNPGSATGIAIAQYALNFNGKGYVFGGKWDGEMPYTPTDCSGFVRGLYKHFGITIPNGARAQSKLGKEVSLKDIEPGDLVFYSDGGPSITHVALYIGNGQIIHARTPAHGVGINKIGIMKRITIRRIL